MKAAMIATAAPANTSHSHPIFTVIPLFYGLPFSK
jgi:hypothetical protein